MYLLEDPDWSWRRNGPSGPAARAFAVDVDELRRLPGGAGQTFTDGRIVLKPVGCVPEHDWVCEVYAGWTCTDVRVPEPVPPTSPPGAPGEHWSYDGWGAHVLLTGRDADPAKEIERVREASEIFHRCLAGLERPTFLDARQDPWAFGDRLAWEGAEPIGDDRTLEVIDRLRAHLAPVSASSQVIHGDILPNVLVAENAPPGVIDWPPYYRPAAFATAVAATDAVTFRDLPLSLLDEWATGGDWRQLLIRALLYRLGPTGVFAKHDRLMGTLRTHVERLGPVVEAVLAR